MNGHLPIKGTSCGKIVSNVDEKLPVNVMAQTGQMMNRSLMDSSILATRNTQTCHDRQPAMQGNITTYYIISVSSIDLVFQKVVPKGD